MKNEGHSKHPLYPIWKEMRQRCLNHKHKNFSSYGGRGIKICERWDSFFDFVDDMGPKPTKDHSIDRIDNNGDYTPENCRWATRSEQQNNKKNNNIVEFAGTKETVANVARELGFGRSAIIYRIKNNIPLDAPKTTAIAYKLKNKDTEILRLKMDGVKTSKIAAIMGVQSQSIRIHLKKMGYSTSPSPNFCS